MDGFRLLSGPLSALHGLKYKANLKVGLRHMVTDQYYLSIDNYFDR
ncbi:hypothetical protein NTE_01672 [Candidatus Nitrososphaera evergladensis SR1]|uniref:Uncharacterized protein n=1 Tax=Candidatus Nitrososphaera evergladensis SR1 TaxID=1459636 RepID=A0A075MRF2_9ARCH|nr:hypothetical protein NTE_01672 [Candidatus Nitrososphaera evergladensis SR1]